MRWKTKRCSHSWEKRKQQSSARISPGSPGLEGLGCSGASPAPCSAPRPGTGVPRGCCKTSDATHSQAALHAQQGRTALMRVSESSDQVSQPLTRRGRKLHKCHKRFWQPGTEESPRGQRLLSSGAFAGDGAGRCWAASLDHLGQSVPGLDTPCLACLGT